MAKLHFYYGTMAASKSAQALMTRYNYIEKGKGVWLIKPSTDTRDGVSIIRSRIGIEAEADVIKKTDSIWKMYCDNLKNKSENNDNSYVDVVICDEAQFLTPLQVTELRKIVDAYNTPVLCYGLKTDFRTHLFPGSKRLVELADDLTEIKTICRCGEKATVNARIDSNGNIQLEGNQVLLGGNESYESLCTRCYVKLYMKSENNTKNYLPEE